MSVALIRRGGGPHVTGETVDEILDVSGRPVRVIRIRPP